MPGALSSTREKGPLIEERLIASGALRIEFLEQTRAQQVLLDLGGRHGPFADEAYMAWNLERGDPAPAERDDLLRRSGRTRAQLDERRRNLLQPRIGDSDHLHHLYRRVRADKGLQLERRHILAADLQQVLETAVIADLSAFT